MPARTLHSATPEGSTATGGRLPPLVGRDAELHTLLNALTDADAKRGSAVLVVGESGVGKTRLVTALAEQASQRGFDVAVGRGYPVETGVPYAVFSDALLPVLRRLDPSALTLLTRGGTEELAQLFPALAAARTGGASPRGDPSEVKARLLWNFSQFLSRYTAKRPLLVVLENLQWADSASLEMLHFVARQLGGDRLLLVATHNDPELCAPPNCRCATSAGCSGFASRRSRSTAWPSCSRDGSRSKRRALRRSPRGCITGPAAIRYSLMKRSSR